jgi:hypothetical protein
MPTVSILIKTNTEVFMSDQIKKCVNRATPNWVKQRESDNALDAANKAVLVVAALAFVGLAVVNTIY